MIFTGRFLRKTLLAGMLTAACSAAPALASDEIDVAKVPEVEVSPTVTSGWYLRGDVGYSFNSFRQGAFSCADCTTAFDQRFLGDLKGAASFAGGVGYQFTDFLRADVTADYQTRASFSSSLVDGKQSSLSLLANAYVDLGNLGGVTPYIGAGLGAAHVNWHNIADQSGSGQFGSESDWRFTYAAMAGISVDLTQNLKLDAGYRFQHINGGSMYRDVNSSASGSDKGMNIHNIRLGLRYMFNG